MSRPLTLFFLFLTGILLVRNVGAGFRFSSNKPLERPDTRPIQYNPKPIDSKPVGTDKSASGESSEAKIKKEDIDYNKTLDAVFAIVEAIDSALNDESPTATLTSIPPGASPCYDFLDYYEWCNPYNSSFNNDTFPVQASCLCYTAADDDEIATWAPHVYDGVMSSCNNYAQTQKQANVTQIGTQFDLCQSAGDVIATPALASASPTSSKSTIPASPSPATATTTPTATLTSTSATASSTSAGHRNTGSALLIAFMGFSLCEILI